MLTPGPAKKITIHLNEDTSAQHDFLYNEIFAFLREHGLDGLVDGYGVHFYPSGDPRQSLSERIGKQAFQQCIRRMPEGHKAVLADRVEHQ